MVKQQAMFFFVQGIFIHIENTLRIFYHSLFNWVQTFKYYYKRVILSAVNFQLSIENEIQFPAFWWSESRTAVAPYHKMSYVRW